MGEGGADVDHLIEWCAHLLRTRNVLGSNFGTEGSKPK